MTPAQSHSSIIIGARRLLLGALCSALIACDSAPKAATAHTDQASASDTLHISGRVQERLPLATSTVYLRDQSGQHWSTHTDAKGHYRIELPRSVQFPLAAAAVSQSGELSDCTRNDILRPICMVSLLQEDQTSAARILNINPLTDRIASDIAHTHNLLGPQQLFAAPTFTLSHDALESVLAPQRAAFTDALTQLAHPQPLQFNPISDAAIAQGKLDALFALLRHNRTYDNNTGATGHTTLSDSRFQPLVGFYHGGAYEPFDFARAQTQQHKIEQARTRIFIVGDSTSSMYETLRYPRMGWGDAFAQGLNARDDLVVVVGSRAGRSSRDFYNGRWFVQMEPFIREGDYVFINHGHNDQNCDSARDIRGAADLANLCTYPNTKEGSAQFPEGQPELSFDNSLMRYVTIARARGATPILLTPSTRILNTERKQQLPVSENHYTATSPGKSYAFTGNYAETIRQIAQRENLPLLELERASIAFANRLSGTDWHNYWLVVPASVNAFYADGVAGSPSRPDGTHFQARGAQAMAQLVHDLIDQGAAATQSDSTTASAAALSLQQLQQRLNSAQ